MWTAVGGALAAFGSVWLLSGGAPWLIAPASILGLAKAHFALRPASVRTIARIRERGDGRCVGGFLSARSWLFVIAMAAAGRLLRSTPVPRAVVGFLYVAVGVGLLLASARLWRAWFLAKKDLTVPPD